MSAGAIQSLGCYVVVGDLDDLLGSCIWSHYFVGVGLLGGSSGCSITLNLLSVSFLDWEVGVNESRTLVTLRDISCLQLFCLRASQLLCSLEMVKI